MSSLQFLGAAGTVTGSRFVIEHEGRRIMVDVGLFQGPKELRQRNWARSPLAAKDVDAVVLTHAHIDHTGGLPRLVAEGFTGPVFTTPATRSLAGLLLPDSAHLQEEEARFANKHRATPPRCRCTPSRTRTTRSSSSRPFRTRVRGRSFRGSR
jgi:metallo-beta-lactamase family protein